VTVFVGLCTPSDSQSLALDVGLQRTNIRQTLAFLKFVWTGHFLFVQNGDEEVKA